MSLRIDIAVGGRFHSDWMAQALLEQGHAVRLLTSYPKSRFPHVDPKAIYSTLLPELSYRGLRAVGLERLGEQAKMTSFGKWVANEIRKDPPDILYCWSSFAKESFAETRAIRILLRDSTHILHQVGVLKEEYRHFGLDYKMDPLCIERELCEYHTADEIIVLSQFAKQTFLDHGVSERKLRVLSLGVNTEVFAPRYPYEPKEPLRAVYFGTLSFRKGVYYFLEATQAFSPKQLEVHLIGPVEPSFRSILKNYPHVVVHPPMSHAALAPLLREMDVYVFPSLEDGFPNTLVQAMASGLVPITTALCGPAEFIVPNEHGIIIPPRNARAIQTALTSLVQNPRLLGPLREKALQLARYFTWERYGEALLPRPSRKPSEVSPRQQPHL